MTYTRFPNLANIKNDTAQRSHTNSIIRKEMAVVGISLVYHASYFYCTDVPANVSGELPSIYDLTFRRGWSYWCAYGKVPLECAKQMYSVEGRKDVRVAGHGCSPPPEEWAEPPLRYLQWVLESEGYIHEGPVRDTILSSQYIDLYHIDTVEGLAFFVESVKNYRKTGSIFAKPTGDDNVAS